ncbi:MAG: oligosaccharide flippase family protein [Solirubrobacteraceae bacterium]
MTVAPGAQAQRTPPPLPLIPYAASESGGGLSDPGVVSNTMLALATQVAGAAFTGGLTLYLVRALGVSGYGIYALAVSIGALVLYPAGMGLPWAVGRFLADHRDDVGQLRAIFVLGLRLQLAAAAVAGVALFALAGPLADAFGDPHLGWPLRWVALSVGGQALFSFLSSAVTSVRRSAIALWMAVIESATETAGSAGLVLAGAGAAGAALGKAIGYGVAAVAGVYLTLRLLRRRVRARAGSAAPRVGLRALTRYAGAMLVVDVTWSAIAQIDVLLIAALLNPSAVGSFGAVLRILAVLSYLGLAVSSGVAPRLSLGSGSPDTRAFFTGIRYLIVVQGVVIAPMVVWATPIIGLLLGHGYRSSPEILRVLAVQGFVSAPAALVSVAVTYLGEARRRLRVVLATLAVGLASTYILIRSVGVVGAAVGDDIVVIVYVAAHLWICSRLITLDLAGLMRSLLRTLLAAAAMALALLAFGTGRLSAVGWVAGLALGGGAYLGVLLVTRELSVGELRSLAGLVASRRRP